MNKWGGNLLRAGLRPSQILLIQQNVGNVKLALDAWATQSSVDAHVLMCCSIFKLPVSVSSWLLVGNGVIHKLNLCIYSIYSIFNFILQTSTVTKHNAGSQVARP